MTTERTQDLDLRHVIGVLRHRAPVILALFVVAVGGAYLLSNRSPKLYQATSSVRISNPNSENVFQNVAQVPVDPRRQVENETQILQSNDLRTLVEQQLGARSREVRRLTVTNAGTTDILEISIVSTSPEIARDAANTYAETYVQRRKERAASELDRRAGELRVEANRLGEQMRALDEQISSRSGSDADSLRSQKGALQNQQNTASNLAFQLGAQAALMNGAVEVADQAQRPGAPIAPRPSRDAALVGILVLLAGVGGALLLDRLDDRITGPDDLEAALPTVPLLASVPIYAPDRRRGAAKLPDGPRTLVPLNSVEAEVYRTLRSNVRYSNLGRTKNVLMVTSSSGSEGKSTVTANLAVALAESSQRVVVVSADLRRPTLSTLFGVDETKRGLSSVLRGEQGLNDCLVPVDLESGHRLYVLPAGPIPHNPAELLGSRMMGELLAGLAQADVDYVLVDCPPVLPVSDPLAVAQHVDGVIMLAVVGRTRAHSLTEACGRLQKVGAEVLGVVLNGVPTTRGRYAHYYYRRYERYGYDGYRAESPPPPAPPRADDGDRVPVRDDLVIRS